MILYPPAEVDLATCKHVKPRVVGSVNIPFVINGRAIQFRGKTVVKIPHARDRIELEGMSPDRKWILYAIDPMGSASLAADGLTVKAVAATGGRSFTVASGLTYSSYRSWCDFSTLVVTSGGDRIANHGKRLIVTGPPSWKPGRLVNEPGRAFGSVACAPDGKSVVVQEEPAGGTDESSAKSHWQLWRISIDGKTTTRLTNPPAGYSDDSPQFSPDRQTLYFVRSKNDHGLLYALRGGKLVGPLLDLGTSSNYYGHRDWPYRVAR